MYARCTGHQKRAPRWHRAPQHRPGSARRRSLSGLTRSRVRPSRRRAPCSTARGSGGKHGPSAPASPLVSRMDRPEALPISCRVNSESSPMRTPTHRAIHGDNCARTGQRRTLCCPKAVSAHVNFVSTAESVRFQAGPPQPWATPYPSFVVLDHHRLVRSQALVEHRRFRHAPASPTTGFCGFAASMQSETRAAWPGAVRSSSGVPDLSAFRSCGFRAWAHRR